MGDEPFKPEEARQLARKILTEGKIRYTGHALQEMEKDGIGLEDIQRSLHGGCDPAEWIHGEWRYRFHSYDIWSVITFRNGQMIVVITAWRK